MSPLSNIVNYTVLKKYFINLMYTRVKSDCAYLVKP